MPPTFAPTILKAIKIIRAGEAAPAELSRLLENYLNGSSAPKTLSSLTDAYEEKIESIDTVMSKGGKYVVFSGSSLEVALLKNQHEDAYAFRFSEACRKDKVAWAEHSDLLFDLLETKSQHALIVIVGRDATDNTLENPLSHTSPMPRLLPRTYWSSRSC